MERDYVVPLIAGAFAAVMFIFGLSRGENATMQQAFERGYAVQCIGKTGYHWECGE